MQPDAPRFWPANPGLQPEGIQPEEILRAAAAELGSVTDQEVVADLRTSASGEWVEHAFYLIAKKVGYRYLLFRARHHLGFPVTIYEGPDDIVPDEAECNTVEELEQTLKQLFEHPTTQRIVGQLRNLSREAS